MTAPPMTGFPLLGTIWKYNGPGGGAGKAHRVLSVDKDQNQIITSSGTDSWLGGLETFGHYFTFLRFHE